MTITATIANTGNADAGASTTRFVRNGTTLIGTASTPAIPEGGTAVVSVNWETAGQTGQHTITISADSATAVAESNEGNNDGTLTVTVKGNKVSNGSFTASSNGSSPDSWSSSGQTSYDGNSASAGPGSSWSSDPVAVDPGTSYDLVVSAAGSMGTVLVEQLSATGLVLGSVSLPALGTLDTPISTLSGTAQVRIVLLGGLTGTTFDDVGLFER
ncbi:MAG: CARDB domain-containing protein [Gaiellaceae bacterium]